MKYCIECGKSRNSGYKKDRNLGYFRILHAHPDAPNIDVYINDKLVIENLPYNSYSNYFPMCSDDYKLSIKMNGSQATPMVVDLLSIKEGELKTLSLAKTQDKAGLLRNVDAADPPEEPISMLRFVHLSPDAPSTDLALSDGTVIFKNISYQEATPYIPLPPSSHTLHLLESETSNALLSIRNVDLKEKKSYSLNMTGLVEGNPRIDALVLLDTIR